MTAPGNEIELFGLGQEVNIKIGQNLDPIKSGQSGLRLNFGSINKSREKIVVEKI